VGSGHGKPSQVPTFITASKGWACPINKPWRNGIGLCPHTVPHGPSGRSAYPVFFTALGSLKLGTSRPEGSVPGVMLIADLSGPLKAYISFTS